MLTTVSQDAMNGTFGDYGHVGVKCKYLSAKPQGIDGLFCNESSSSIEY